MTTQDYKTAAGEGCAEFTEKRSRFIGYCRPIACEREAVEFINEIRSKHRDATHNVYAYSLRQDNIKRHSDDGEPSGTAGMPVLDVITKNELVDTAVVVTRYFGGVLLGTGGLVRAYSYGAKLALEAARVVTMKVCYDCKLRCTYNQYGRVSAIIPELGGVVDNTVYESDVEILFHITPNSYDILNKRLADSTSGQAAALVEREKYYKTDFSQVQ